MTAFRKATTGGCLYTKAESWLAFAAIGYVNDVDHFDKHLPEYETFLSKISPMTQMTAGAP